MYNPTQKVKLALKEQIEDALKVRVKLSSNKNSFTQAVTKLIHRGMVFRNQGTSLLAYRVIVTNWNTSLLQR